MKANAVGEARDDRADDYEATLNEAVQVAKSLHQEGKLDDAEAMYRSVLDARPKHPDAAHFLGLLLHQRGRSDQGIAWIKKAIAADPAYADAHNNLGNIYNELNRPEEAVEEYRLAVKHAPGLANANIHLVKLLCNLDRDREAMEHLEAAIQDHPALTRLYKLYGSALRVAGRVEEAAAVFRKWRDCDPTNAAARHLYEACSGESVSTRAADDYVRDEFDGFAESFDRKLEKLQYRAPQLVLTAVEREHPTPSADLVILDAGCGTGLCGPLLKPYASRLIGIDLSPGMLAKAQERGLYDDLIAGELTEQLAGCPGAFDLVVAADVLVYFGDLAPFLAAAHAALRPGGRLVFTVERSDAPNGPSGYRLAPSGRYLHSANYVRAALAAAGFECRGMADAHLRTEMLKPVEGLLVAAGR